MSGEPPIDGELDDSGAEPSQEELQAANALRQALEGRLGGTHLPEPALETAALLRCSSDAGRLPRERRAALRAELLASLPPTSGSARKPRKGWRHWLGLGLTLAGGVTAVVVIGVIGARQLSEPTARQEARWADARSVSATANEPVAPTPPGAPAAAEPATAGVPAEAAPAAARRAEPEAPARFAANRARESEPAAEVAGAPSAAAKPASKSLASGAASADGAPGGGAAPALARRLAQAGPAAEMRDDAAEAKKGGAAPTVPTEQVRRASDKYRSQLLAELADPLIDGAYDETDRAQSKAELERAQTRLGALASSGLGTSANAERLRPDIYCRLAEVALRLGQPQAALDWTRRGLALGAPASPFVARLYLLEGQAKSALGDRDGAAKSYLKAIEVNEQLLDESLDGP